jgi:hypothetical protein
VIECEENPVPISVLTQKSLTHLTFLKRLNKPFYTIKKLFRLSDELIQGFKNEPYLVVVIKEMLPD